MAVTAASPCQFQRRQMTDISLCDYAADALIKGLTEYFISWRSFRAFYAFPIECNAIERTGPFFLNGRKINFGTLIASQ